MFCESCGDWIPDAAITGSLEDIILATHCKECGLELAFGIIPKLHAETYPSGHGCPLEPNEDDAGPWQENAIRDLEG
jgi:hypothetical protein